MEGEETGEPMIDLSSWLYRSRHREKQGEYGIKAVANIRVLCAIIISNTKGIIADHVKLALLFLCDAVLSQRSVPS
jgi:hypothetical protein